MRVLVTGASGFIAKNLIVRLNEEEKYTILEFNREDPIESLSHLVGQADVIVHLAGENRPKDISSFKKVNADLTKTLCDEIKAIPREILFIFASSTQANLNNPYGKSKRAAEIFIEDFAVDTGNPTYIYRLPNVFGKWCKPNYNSVVATFCHNIANDRPIKVHEPSAKLKLVYVDDVVTKFIDVFKHDSKVLSWETIEPEYSITLGELADQIKAFKKSRNNLISEHVGIGFIRALYSTYVSYLPPAKFSYFLPCHADERGIFVEMLKTKDSGQFSYFTTQPGVTRGGHYHHSKTEKFIVIKGSARFGFRNIVSDETYEVFSKDKELQVVESIPGWTHDITNIGEKEMVVMVWANEIFDKDCPDTVKCEV